MDARVANQPFGRYRIPYWCEVLVSLCHRIPVRSWLGKRFAFLVRKPLLMRKQAIVDISIEGLKLRLAPKGNLSDKRLYTMPDLLDGEERRFFGKTLRQGAVVLDVGANIGGFGLLLANVRKDIKVVAVEAHPDLARRIQLHIDFNQLQGRCRCLQVAATSKNETVVLHVDTENQGKNSLLKQDSRQAAASAIDVEGMTLRDIVGVTEGEQVDLLKMDVEGFECPVLESFFSHSEESLWPMYLQLEHEGGAGNSDASLLAQKNGYQEVFRTRMNIILKKG